MEELDINLEGFSLDQEYQFSQGSADQTNREKYDKEEYREN